MHGRRRVEGNQTRGPERSTMNPVYGQKVTEEARRERLVARGRLDARGGLDARGVTRDVLPRTSRAELPRGGTHEESQCL